MEERQRWNFLILSVIDTTIIILPQTNIAPENGWLEDKHFLVDMASFSGAFAVSFGECGSIELL